MSYSNGGYQEFNLHNLNGQDLIEPCYKHGYTDIRICIQGMYENELSEGDWLQYEGSAYYNLGFNNYVDATLPMGIESFEFRSWNIEEDKQYTMVYPNEQTLHASILSTEGFNYKWEISKNKISWNSLEQGIISTVEARNGAVLEYTPSFGIGTSGNLYYRLVVVGNNINDTSVVFTGKPCFSYEYSDGGSYNYPAGEKFNRPKSTDCRAYDFDSEFPVKQRDLGNGHIEITMPACPVVETEITPTYTVKFVNRDNNHTVLKTQQVACGESATAPANPTLAGATFTGWSCDFTNVHKDLVVWATYDFGTNFTAEILMKSHVNEVNPMPAYQFAGNDNMAMVGDKIVLEFVVKTPATGSIFFEQGYYDQYGNLNWLGGDSKGGTEAGVQKIYDEEVNIAWYPWSLTENPFQRRQAYRFYVSSGGTTIYTETMEFDVYYPQTVQTDGSMLVSCNDVQAGGTEVTVPARYGDTIYVERLNGTNACLSMARTVKPSSSLDDGLDGENRAFFLCPGETETINVSVSQVAVIFDGAWPTQQFDFSAQGFGKHNAYYAEISECGGQVLPPADPTYENMIFKGWTAWSTDYADDAYLCIPAGAGNIIGFQAVWEDIPVATIYTVTFKDWDGTTLKTEEVAEGENATPPAVGGRSGYHFVGWDGSYTTITHNVTLTAQYGEDEKVWTVTFLDWDDTQLSVVQVPDGMAAPEPIAVRDGYQFQYWMNNNDHLKADVTHVWSDMTVKAFYTSTEGLEEVIINNSAGRAQKVLFNGQVLIFLPDGKIFNVLGQPVR